MKHDGNSLRFHDSHMSTPKVGEVRSPPLFELVYALIIYYINSALYKIMLATTKCLFSMEQIKFHSKFA